MFDIIFFGWIFGMALMAIVKAHLREADLESNRGFPRFLWECLIWPYTLVKDWSIIRKYYS